MPLDPEIRVYLERQAALGVPPAWQLTPQQARQASRDTQAAAKRLAVRSVEDRSLPGPGGDLRVRSYRPAAPGPLPLVVFLHGGGWVVGDLDTHDATCRRLCAELNAVSLGVDYRLAPESPFPAAFEDALTATRWCLANAAELGADPRRVVVMGDSAGGNLAAAVAIALRGEKSRPVAQVLVYPATDLRPGTDRYRSRTDSAEGFGLSQQGMDWFVGCYAAQEWQRSDPRASPILAPDLSGLPPTLVMTAEYDPLRSEGEAYAERLGRAGVEVEHHCVAGANHGVLSNIERFAAGERFWVKLLGWIRERVYRDD